MSIITVLMIAIALSMDSFSVSISSGIFLKKVTLNKSFEVAVILAVFQGGMTFIGWALGINFSSYISAIDHWIAFVLLSYLGIKMIYESFKEDKDEIESLSYKRIMLLGLATSIDALAVGVGFAFLKTSIIMPLIVITLTTLFFSLLGLFTGAKFGNVKWFNVELVGGAILIIIGLKILIEHLFLNQ